MFGFSIQADWEETAMEAVPILKTLSSERLDNDKPFLQVASSGPVASSSAISRKEEACYTSDQSSALPALFYFMFLIPY